MRRPLARLTLLAALALPSLSATAWAAPPSANQPPLSQSLKGAAREAYGSAEILSRNSDFPGALSKYRQAYELSNDPRLLFNMALCERSLHAYARMQALLLQYKREAATTISTEDRADVDAALAAIQRLVGAIRLEVDEVGATVTVDGEPAGTTPLASPVVLDLGEHTVVVSKAGFEDVTRAVKIDGGSEMPVAVQLVEQKHVAQLVVASDEGATVILDDQVVAKGRFEGSLPAGAHALRVTEPGRRSYTAQLDLRDGETRTVQVTLESDRHGAPIWPWVAGGVAVAAGLAVGGYFLFRSPSTEAPVSGAFGTVQLTNGWIHF